MADGKPGRPKLTDEEKKQNKDWKAAGLDPKVERAKLKAGSKTTEHDRVVLEDLTDEQEQVLFYQHKRAYDKALDAKKKADADLKNVAKKVKADLGANGVDQIKLMHSLETDEGKRALKERFAWQQKVARWALMPVGFQGDLLDEEDRTPIEDRIFNEGKRAGLAGDDPSPPSIYSGPNQSKWTEGYHEGQAVLAKGFKTHTPKGDEFGAPPADETQPTNWYAAGAEAFVNGANGTVPDDVPEEHRDGWLQGWSKASEAHAKRMDAKKRDEQRAAA